MSALGRRDESKRDGEGVAGIGRQRSEGRRREDQTLEKPLTGKDLYGDGGGTKEGPSGIELNESRFRRLGLIVVGG